MGPEKKMDSLEKMVDRMLAAKVILDCLDGGEEEQEEADRELWLDGDGDGDFEDDE